MKWFFCAAAGIALIALICLPLSWALLWQLPLAFFAALLGAMLLYWLFLAIVSLSIQKQRDYDAPSPFYYRLLNEMRLKKRCRDFLHEGAFAYEKERKSENCIDEAFAEGKLATAYVRKGLSKHNGNGIM